MSKLIYWFKKSSNKKASEKLWEITESNTVYRLEVSKVDQWVYYPCWYDNKTKSKISIHEVLSDPIKFKYHIDKIDNVDISYPIIIADDKSGTNKIILDGYYRFANVVKNNKQYILYKYVKPYQLKN